MIVKKIIVTTSWDDGHNLDLKTASLLKKYDLRGTFYIPKQFNSRLTEEEILEISKTQEIGAHTKSHASLTEIDLVSAKQEIDVSKKWLESLLGQPIKMFCYPRGLYNDQIKEEVRRAGFIGARSVLYGEEIKDPFELPVNLQIYPFPCRKRNARTLHWSKFLFQPLTRKFSVIRKNHLPWKSFLSWSNFAEQYFLSVLSRSGFLHLWGHSWEIEKYGMWGQLEKFLKVISSRKDTLYLTNSEAIWYAHHGSN